MMLSREPGLGRDTSFIPDSHGRLGPALIGPFCVGEAVSTYRLSSVEVESEGGTGRAMDFYHRTMTMYWCAIMPGDLAETILRSVVQSRGRDDSAT